MRLEKLAARDFRGFASLDLDFEPDVTVLVGVNGAGKTSILDALAVMLSSVVEGIRGAALAPPQLDLGDVRVGTAAAQLEVRAKDGAEAVAWSTAITRPGHPPRDGGDVAALRPVVARAQSTVEAGEPRLPLAVYFLTNRNALDIPERIRTRHEFAPLSAYDGALDAGVTSFREFFEWFREAEDLYNERIAREKQAMLFAATEEATKLPIVVVKKAIDRLFRDALDLRIERSPQRMTALRRGVRLDVSRLSDGEKCLLATAGDLARRMVLAAPNLHDPLDQEAIVLVDELELHLHPGLQREILPRLCETFPNTQFVATTHSPQVLSSVRARNVRLLEDFKVRPLDEATWHRDTNDILGRVFGDPGRPPEVAGLLNQLRAAIDADEPAAARDLLRQLEGMIEGTDPDVFFLAQQLPPEDAESRA